MLTKFTETTGAGFVEFTHILTTWVWNAISLLTKNFDSATGTWRRISLLSHWRTYPRTI